MATYGTRLPPAPPEHPVERGLKRWNSTTTVLGILLSAAIGVIAILVTRPTPTPYAHLQATLYVKDPKDMPLQYGGARVDDKGVAHFTLTFMNTSRKVFAKGMAARIRACVDCMLPGPGVSAAGPFTFDREFKSEDSLPPGAFGPPIELTVGVTDYAKSILVVARVVCESCDNPEHDDILRLDLLRQPVAQDQGAGGRG